MAMIRINYSQAIRESDRLRTIATEYQNMYVNLNNIIGEVQNCWQGAAATAFIAQCEQWKREASAIKNELTTLSSTVRRVANEIREAELRAIAAMKK